MEISSFNCLRHTHLKQRVHYFLQIFLTGAGKGLRPHAFTKRDPRRNSVCHWQTGSLAIMYLNFLIFKIVITRAATCQRQQRRTHQTRRALSPAPCPPAFGQRRPFQYLKTLPRPYPIRPGSAENTVQASAGLCLGHIIALTTARKSRRAAGKLPRWKRRAKKNAFMTREFPKPPGTSMGLYLEPLPSVCRMSLTEMCPWTWTLLFSPLSCAMEPDVLVFQKQPHPSTSLRDCLIHACVTSFLQQRDPWACLSTFFFSLIFFFSCCFTLN